MSLEYMGLWWFENNSDYWLIIIYQLLSFLKMDKY